MGIEAVHAVVDHTDRNPASDPTLTKSLLEQLGPTIPLPLERSATIAGTSSAVV